MNTITRSSDEARREWRELLDTAMTGGGEVVIERWNKPIAVLVNYEHWNLLKRQRRAYLDRLSSEIDAGEFVTHEQVLAEMRAREQID